MDRRNRIYVLKGRSLTETERLDLCRLLMGSLFIKTDERRERKEEDCFDAGGEICISKTLVVDLSDGRAHYLNEDTFVSPVECEIVFSVDRSGNT